MSRKFSPRPANKALFYCDGVLFGLGKLYPLFLVLGRFMLDMVKKNLGSMKQPRNRAWGVGISAPGGLHNWVRQSCGLTSPVLMMVLFCCVLTMMAQIMKYYILRRLVWVLPGFRKNGVLKGWVEAEPMPGCWEVHPGGDHGVGTPCFWSAVQLGFMF